MELDVHYLNATDLAERIRTKELSPVEVVQAHLDRIAEVNPRVNAITTLTGEQALEAAKHAEKEVLQGRHLGPFHGVPFTIKDSLDTAGVPTMRGSKIFEHRVPAEDATAVARFKAAGAIPLAKTNLPEFTYWTESDNHVTGYTLNPWDLTRTAGGSSGGEAAAIAAGMSPIGIGSDVAISVRGPAHYTGISALKPTHGLIPATGHWPVLPRRYWHIGPMARSVRDLDAALAVLSGRDGRDGYATSNRYTQEAVNVGELRVGWLTQPEFGPLDPDVASAVVRASEALGNLGLRVEPVHIPALERNYVELAFPLYCAEVGQHFTDAAVGRADELHPVITETLAMPKPSLAEYVECQHAVEELRAGFVSYFANFDLLLCPVVPIPAPLPYQTQYEVAGCVIPAYDVMRATAPFNLTGLPALSLPFGICPEGLPIGVQLVGPWHRESTILGVAALLESRSAVAGLRPPL
jgi:Asp-tRNA(Asn)/Glu-tRNA(Gln) amidotransferase A subunit family amidase